MIHYLKRSLELLVPVLLFLLPTNAQSIPAVEGHVETLPETNTNDDIAPKLTANSPTADTFKTEPPQPQEQRGHWGTPVSYHHYALASGDENISITDAATKEETSADTIISDLEVQHFPFISTTNKQKNKIPAHVGGKNKPQPPIEQSKESRGGEGSPTIDITITRPSGGTAGEGEPTDNRIMSHVPPEGFTLTAHIITNPHDRQSYFTTAANDPQGPKDELLIPFLECGAVGSTTQGIPLHRAYFRHFPKSAHPTEFTPALEPHLLICLNQLEMVVSGGNDGEEKRVFERGSVILVEDVMGRGHKLYSSDGDVSVLMLTLPPSSSHHHGIGKKDESGSSVAGISRRVGGGLMSLFGKKRQKKNSKSDGMANSDCLLEHDPAYSALGLQSQSDAENDEISFVRTMARNAPRKRRVAWASIGLGLSTLTAIFLSKVAPLQLAVGIGGACVVGGGTIGVVKGGEWVCDEIEVWIERQDEMWRVEEITSEEEEKEEVVVEETIVVEQEVKVEEKIN